MLQLWILGLGTKLDHFPFQAFLSEVSDISSFCDLCMLFIYLWGSRALNPPTTTAVSMWCMYYPIIEITYLFHRLKKWLHFNDNNQSLSLKCQIWWTIVFRLLFLASSVQYNLQQSPLYPLAFRIHNRKITILPLYSNCIFLC